MDSYSEHVSGTENHDDDIELTKEMTESISDDIELSTEVSESVPTQDCTLYRGKPYKDLTFDDLVDVEFETLEEVENFYSCYSFAKGFSMRKSRMDKNREGTLVLRRDLICSRQGVRESSGKKYTIDEKEGSLEGDTYGIPMNMKGKHDMTNSSGLNSNKKRVRSTRRESREKCQARLIVRRCKTRGVYYAAEFITEHSHSLTKTEHRHFEKSHRHVKDSDLAQVNALRKVSVRTCRAYEYLVDQAGGYEFVGFTLKDLYNAMQGERAEILVDGDAQSAITWMNMKALQDPHFTCVFSVDEKGRLANMFWRDGQSLTDYNAFGDVLIFDATYNSNIYEKPLAVFVGCNNHRAIVLFGCAFLVDETEETYNWVLTAFLSSMNKKKPISVLTDGVDAMANAICRLIPEARHRLCAWHIGNNVSKHLRDKDTQRDFFHLIFAGLTLTEWETQWCYFVTMNRLQNNQWVTSMYRKREKWAEAFFRDHFFGGISSTQRCEGMHRNLRGGIGRYMRLFEVLPCMEKNNERIRNRVLYDDYRSDQFRPVYGGNMVRLQKEIGKIFTHDVFLLIRDQITYESDFVVKNEDVNTESGASSFMIYHYEKPERQWIVSCNNDERNVTFFCSCQLFESDGIPCCHIFSVFKYQFRTKFPDSLVKKRWTKEVTVGRTLSNLGLANDNAVQLARYGDLMSACAKFCHVASFSDEGYEETKEAIHQFTIHGQKYRVPNQNTLPIDSLEGLHPNVIKDPVVCKSKGTKSKTCGYKKKKGRKCGVFHNIGHDARTCGRDGKGKKRGVHKAINDSSATEFETEITESNSSDGDASLREMDQSNATSDNDVEEDMVTQGQATNLIYHRQESRHFEFFSGYDESAPGNSTTNRNAYPNYFEHYPPFPHA